MNKDSQRAIKTKERIRDAFFELYTEKKIEHISIKEIAEKAQMNRSTFYAYYKDIYDLLEKSEDELIEELVIKLKDIVIMLLRGEDIEPFLPPLKFYQHYSKFLRVLLGANGDPNFVHKMKKIIKKTLKDLLQKENTPPIENFEYVMEYISSAQIGIISFWLSNDMALPVAELGDLIRRITLNGPIGFLKMQAAVNPSHIAP